MLTWKALVAHFPQQCQTRFFTINLPFLTGKILGQLSMSSTAPANVKEDFETLQACVIIPTYNNAATLATVIRDVMLYTDQVIVVNDGSTDHTLEIVRQFPAVQLVTYEKNVGKGWALRQAFKYAVQQGYKFAITIDSDGQHFAKDLPVFINKLKEEKNVLIIGSRNMNQSSVPGKSSFGHKFSNFWFKVETGIACPDTQSGYRLYPVWLLRNTRLITRKYEFEIEVLVRSAWKGIEIESVPVSVYYPPKEERVSHFRPFKDFTRISILNTVLVLITFLYIKPRDFIRSLFQKKKLKEMVQAELFGSHYPDSIKALSVAFGIFMGIIPIWGFQLVVAIFLAILFRLNKLLVIIAANISIPPMIPIIIFTSYKAGAYWMGADASEISFHSKISLETIQKNLQQYIYGSITLAIVAGIVAGLLTFVLLKLFKRKTVLAQEARS
jgi:glycosyltransferase involved in cell wall biosynthesis